MKIIFIAGALRLSTLLIFASATIPSPVLADEAAPEESAPQEERRIMLGGFFPGMSIASGKAAELMTINVGGTVGFEGAYRVIPSLDVGAYYLGSFTFLMTLFYDTYYVMNNYGAQVSYWFSKYFSVGWRLGAAKTEYVATTFFIPLDYRVGNSLATGPKFSAEIPIGRGIYAIGFEASHLFVSESARIPSFGVTQFLITHRFRF